MGQMK